MLNLIEINLIPVKRHSVLHSFVQGFFKAVGYTTRSGLLELNAIQPDRLKGAEAPSPPAPLARSKLRKKIKTFNF